VAASATDRALNWIQDVRRNHALEHATVQLMLARLGPTFHLVGRASSDGFYILGNVPLDVLEESAHDALARLKAGEGYWAVTPLCGTNIAVTGLLTSLAALRAAKGGQPGSHGRAFTAAMLAVVAARPLGQALQRWVTTSQDLQWTEIERVSVLSARLFKVRTREATKVAAS
jgi:hypothetical protein